MKHTLSTTDITILEHIVFVAEKSAKMVQFYFKKGTEQTYITFKKDILVTFNLSEPIGFDYPVNDLKKFLTTNPTGALDSNKNSVDISSMVIHTEEDEESFKTDVVQELDFTLDDLKSNQRLKKYKHLNIMGENKKCIFRYQNHEKSWWWDDGNREIIEHGKSSRKFRYVIERDKLRLLPNDYKLILRDNSIQFQYKHLNYYFLPDINWKRQSVKDWTDLTSMVDDEHLIAQYVAKGYMQSQKKKSEIELPLKPYKKDLSIVADYLDASNFTKVKTRYTKGNDWTALSLHGYGANTEDILKPSVLKSKVNFYTKLQWTLLISSNAIKPLMEILDTLPCDFERVRVMKLSANKSNGKHTDKVDKDITNKKIVRLHIPIRTNDDVAFTIYKDTKDNTGETFNLKTGHYYYIDVSKPHSVSNNSDVDRYHLVVDCFVNDKLSLLLGLSNETTPSPTACVSSKSPLKHAIENDYDKVNMIFQPYKKDYFPHLRKDYLTRMIKSGNVILDKEVVITYNQYKRKTTMCEGAIAQKGDYILHQIASKKHNGSATKVLQRFFKFVNARVFLTVRSDNLTAKKFYEKNGMNLVGHTSWSKGTLLGDVYLLERHL